jgi:hypothetical protein
MFRPFLSALSLFGSVGTLLCCALPTLFVALGMGATVAGAVSAFPQLVWLSEKKAYLFVGCALLLAFAGWLQWRARREPCPLDPKLAAACGSARRWSLGVYLGSLALFTIGVFFAYLGPMLLF